MKLSPPLLSIIFFSVTYHDVFLDLYTTLQHLFCQAFLNIFIHFFVTFNYICILSVSTISKQTIVTIINYTTETVCIYNHTYIRYIPDFYYVVLIYPLHISYTFRIFILNCQPYIIHCIYKIFSFYILKYRQHMPFNYSLF